MRTRPFVSIVCTAALLAFSSGCLITRHTTNVVRKDEKPRAVTFESPQAKNMFDAKVVEVRSNLAGMSNPKVVAVPFLLWWSSTEVVSDSGIYNDQVAICDVNGDGVVTLDEANFYAAGVDEKIAKQNAEKAKIEADLASHDPARNTVLSRRDNPPTTPTISAQPVSVQQSASVQQSSYSQPQAPLPPGEYR
jgi:hypothetical protein